MQPTRTAYGIWNGGRYMHFGQMLDEARIEALIRQAWQEGVRTFVTADVYDQGGADRMIGKALAEFPRESYCLVGAVGHDWYQGKREGSKGFPRFSDARLRPLERFSDYLKFAAESSLQRCAVDRFDLLLLHNPDAVGFASEAVWKAMRSVREEGMTESLGVAPGPANGYTLDLILCFERFGEWIDWAMIILNPFEPWPGKLGLPAAERFDVKLITRVVDYGGLFHDDVRPGHVFGEKDHRKFRPDGWVEAGNEKLDRLRECAERHHLTMLQLACLWNLSHASVKTVVPTLIQEQGDQAKSIEAKLQELSRLPELELDLETVAMIESIGDNQGCMMLKGGNPDYSGEAQADRWEMNSDLKGVAERWNIRPQEELTYHG